MIIKVYDKTWTEYLSKLLQINSKKLVTIEFYSLRSFNIHSVIIFTIYLYSFIIV